ncbi:MAG: TetR/AcrR family transcriptional regulator [Clostridia bacterium]|nr:TetR/AcrR family transcriptional regulator [Clostridia bacterium]
MPIRVFSQEEREEIRVKMLDAGFPILKEYGMTHTSISKITKAAGIGVSTFYNFWKTKEAYMTELISYYRKKKLPLMVDEEVLSRNRKLSRIEVKKYFQALVDENISIYPHMTLEDEYKLVNSSNSFKPDIEKETTIAKELFSYFENVRDDIDFGLVANLTKILAITAESKAELHEGAYDKTIDKIIDMILDLIFKE